jgi:hypothetical protein
MSNNMFIKKENIQMLWDVISDEDIFKFISPDIQSKVYNLFLNNIHGFFENEKTKINTLVDLNKKYILLILNHIKKTYPYQPSKIKIHNEQPIKELITFEEIQNDRKSQFDRDFSRRQEEFEVSMSIKAPPVPDFNDKNTDKPIKEMDKILKEMQAHRNYEVEQINHSYNTSNYVDNWLKPQETSLKSEKSQNNVDKLEKHEETYQGNRFKYLNELDENKITKKNVSFNNNDEVKTFISEQEQQEYEEDLNIFKKLKKFNKNEDNITLQMSDSIDYASNLNEDRIATLEKNVENLNFKINKIIDLLNTTIIS